MAPCRDGASPPPFRSGKPVQVVATVDGFHHRGAWIDFDHDFIAYDSIVLIVSKPDRHAYTQLWVQYQGTPTARGRRIELGDRLHFTVPVVPDNGCCEPYLNELKDIEFVDPEYSGGDG